MREDTGQHLHPLLVSNSLTGLLSHIRRPGRHVEHVEGGLVLIELNVLLNLIHCCQKGWRDGGNREARQPGQNTSYSIVLSDRLLGTLSRSYVSFTNMILQ